jgi:hypothetical protein
MHQLRYFVGGNGTFAVEDLTISCTGFYNNIIADGTRPVSDPWVRCDKSALPRCKESAPAWQHSRGVRIRRVRIRADCFFRLTERGAGARRGLMANFTCVGKPRADPTLMILCLAAVLSCCRCCPATAAWRRRRRLGLGLCLPP